MYTFSNSILESVGEYKIELYDMGIFSYDDVTIEIELKIFGEKEYETYMADFDITKGDGSSASATCMNRPTKEETFFAVEETVVEMLGDENTHWK